MNSNILKKCIDELKEEDPNIDYVRGMLETLYEIQAPAVPVRKDPDISFLKDKPKDEVSEKDFLESKAKAAIAEVKRLTGESIS